MRIPEFFIIGAPKCGTTGVYSYLRSRPDIFMPQLKEPHYFSFDLPGRRDVVDERYYLELFASAPKAAKLGEASASYLFSQVAISEIMKINPEARMIAMLRNPIDTAYSFHSERLFNLSENIEDFKVAWNLQDSRLQTDKISKFCREPKLLQYRKVCSFSKQIERFFDIVPEKQRLVCIFEDFKKKPREIYLSILSFLDIPDDGRRHFPAVNTSKALRSRRLAEWDRSLRSSPGSWYRIADGMGAAIGLRPSKIIRRLNAKRQARSQLEPCFRRQLADEFATDVRKLERLLKRRLDCWQDFDATHTTMDAL